MRCADQAWPSVEGWGSSSTRRSARVPRGSISPVRGCVVRCIAGLRASSPICRLRPEPLLVVGHAGPILERNGRNGGGGSGRTLHAWAAPAGVRFGGSVALPYLEHVRAPSTCRSPRTGASSGSITYAFMPSRACSYAPETAPISALKAMAAGAWPVTTGHAAPSSPGPCAVLHGAHATVRTAHDGGF